MKTFLNLITAMMLVLFMSACGSSSSGDPITDDGITGGGDTINTVANSEQSGVYTSSFNGAAEKTWYTWKAEVINDGKTYIMNTASFNAPSESTMVGATSIVGTDGTNGSLIFTLPFGSGATTGDLVVGQIQYGDTKDATNYTYLQGMLGSDVVATITEASNVGNVLHIKGSFTGTIYDGMDNTGNPKDPQSLSVNFEFDAHRTDIDY